MMISIRMYSNCTPNTWCLLCNNVLLRNVQNEQFIFFVITLINFRFVDQFLHHSIYWHIGESFCSVKFSLESITMTSSCVCSIEHYPPRFPKFCRIWWSSFDYKTTWSSNKTSLLSVWSHNGLTKQQWSKVIQYQSWIQKIKKTTFLITLWDLMLITIFVCQSVVYWIPPIRFVGWIFDQRLVLLKNRKFYVLFVLNISSFHVITSTHWCKTNTYPIINMFGQVMDTIGSVEFNQNIFNKSYYK